MTLSRNDTAFLKGIAILMIVMHNFCHWLPGCVEENEYTFDSSRILTYIGYIIQGGPHLVLNFFSHYGHYGVPLFLFLSGYGLVKKYESTKTKRSGTNEQSALAFIWQHAVKLWRLMLPALLTYWLCTLCFGKPWTTKPTDLLAMVTYTANLFYQRDLILGPWWFFSLILQLYIIYRLLLYPTRPFSEGTSLLRRHGVLVAVVLVCFALQGWLYYFDVRMTPDWHLHLHDTHPRHWDLFNYCRYNFLGSMLPFALGIVWAREEKQHAGMPSSRAALWTTAIAGTALLLTSAIHSALWMLSPVFLLMALVPLAPLTVQPKLRKPLEWIGSISAMLFALHPIVRAFTFRYAKQADLQGEWFTTCLILLLYVAISLAAARLFSWLQKPHNLKTS